MGFFDDAPQPGPDEPRPHGYPWSRPAAVRFPAVGASGLLLARTSAVAVAVTAVWAYPEGFEFWVEAQFREGRPRPDELPDEESLRFGVQFADGRKAASAGRLPDPAGSEEAGLIMSPRGFGGGFRHQDRSY
jgi:hypothetical protein